MKNYKLLSSIEVLKYRYRYYSKRKKGEVLRELEEQFGVNRKYLIRLFAPKVGGRPKNPRRQGSPSRYSEERPLLYWLKGKRAHDLLL